MIDLLEVSGKKLIGQPLESLIGKATVSRDGYRVYIDGDVPVLLGQDYSLDKIIKENYTKRAWPIVKVDRYYNEVVVTITPPAEVTHV